MVNAHVLWEAECIRFDNIYGAEMFEWRKSPDALNWETRWRIVSLIIVPERSHSHFSQLLHQVPCLAVFSSQKLKQISKFI